MTSQSIASLALPELILGGSALGLLVWGAFRGRADLAFIVAAVAALLAAAHRHRVRPARAGLHWRR